MQAATSIPYCGTEMVVIRSSVGHDVESGLLEDNNRSPDFVEFLNGTIDSRTYNVYVAQLKKQIKLDEMLLESARSRLTRNVLIIVIPAFICASVTGGVALYDFIHADPSSIAPLGILFILFVSCFGVMVNLSKFNWIGPEESKLSQRKVTLKFISNELNKERILNNVDQEAKARLLSELEKELEKKE